MDGPTSSAVALAGMGGSAVLAGSLDVSRIRETTRRGRLWKLVAFLAPITAYLYYRIFTNNFIRPGLPHFNETQVQILLPLGLIVVLCIVPTTAPFSTLGSTDLVFGRSADAVIDASAGHASVDGTDDNDALLLERLPFLRHPILCALVVAAPDDAAAVVSTASFPPGGSRPFAIDSSPRHTILRV